jgi:hypothetical protein
MKIQSSFTQGPLFLIEKNHTRTLQNEDKEEISDHEGKA